MKPRIYTEVIVLKITPIQKQTLNKLKLRNVRVSDFIRKAIAEKIKRDCKELEVKPKKEYCPF
jgi:post-segregation antitoxin (ccd killing protein)